MIRNQTIHIEVYYSANKDWETLECKNLRNCALNKLVSEFLFLFRDGNKL